MAPLLIAASTASSPGCAGAGVVVGGLVVAGFFLFVESLMKGFTLRGFSTATFGLPPSFPDPLTHASRGGHGLGHADEEATPPPHGPGPAARNDRRGEEEDAGDAEELAKWQVHRNVLEIVADSAGSQGTSRPSV